MDPFFLLAGAKELLNYWEDISSDAREVMKAASVLRYSDHWRQVVEEAEADANGRLEKVLTEMSKLRTVVSDAHKASKQAEDQRRRPRTS